MGGDEVDMDSMKSGVEILADRALRAVQSLA
jgi:hypothetical protein